ncbi:hypothetical protein GQ42DRAFT_177329 [Ramicandelaber brevisporus]|nr:hypothetical protein GQ42DRAFT_177329 [Ramicandelaber brevisporus]
MESSMNMDHEFTNGGGHVSSGLVPTSVAHLMKTSHGGSSIAGAGVGAGAVGTENGNSGGTEVMSTSGGFDAMQSNYSVTSAQVPNCTPTGSLDSCMVTGINNSNSNSNSNSLHYQPSSSTASEPVMQQQQQQQQQAQQSGISSQSVSAASQSAMLSSLDNTSSLMLTANSQMEDSIHFEPIAATFEEMVAISLATCASQNQSPSAIPTTSTPTVTALSSASASASLSTSSNNGMLPQPPGGNSGSGSGSGRRSNTKRPQSLRIGQSALGNIVMEDTGLNHHQHLQNTVTVAPLDTFKAVTRVATGGAESDSPSITHTPGMFTPGFLQAMQTPSSQMPPAMFNSFAQRSNSADIHLNDHQSLGISNGTTTEHGSSANAHIHTHAHTNINGGMSEMLNTDVLSMFLSSRSPPVSTAAQQLQQSNTSSLAAMNNEYTQHQSSLSLATAATNSITNSALLRNATTAAATSSIHHRRVMSAFVSPHNIMTGVDVKPIINHDSDDADILNSTAGNINRNNNVNISNVNINGNINNMLYTSMPVTPLQPLGASISNNGYTSSPLATDAMVTNAIQNNVNVLPLGSGISQPLNVINCGNTSEASKEYKLLLIMTPKVGQKSYGTEKRFVTPSPTVYIIGNNFGGPVNHAVSNTLVSTNNILNDNNDRRASNHHPLNALGGQHSLPLVDTGFDLPRVTFAIANDQQLSAVTQVKMDFQIPITDRIKSIASKYIEMSSSMPAGVNTSASAAGLPSIPVTGRCMARQLFINDVDEKKKSVDLIVKLQDGFDNVLGTFKSAPIKVISKPAKRKTGTRAGPDSQTLTHGSCIALFNRLRSQTVSTKYLGTNASFTSIATRPTHFTDPSDPAGSDSIVNDPSNVSPSFVVRTGWWDTFVIWLINPDGSLKYPPYPTNSSQSQSEQHQQQQQQQQSAQPFRPPPPAYNGPACAVPGAPLCGPYCASTPGRSRQSNQNGYPMCPQNVGNGPSPAIHYNDRVVLQCVSTGMVSPPMLLRRIDHANMAVGGALTSRQGTLSRASTPINETSVASGNGNRPDYYDEEIGDPVQQLNKVALEMDDRMESEQIQNDVRSYLGNISNINANSATAAAAAADGASTGCALSPNQISVAKTFISNGIRANYLACVGDTVTMHRSPQDKVFTQEFLQVINSHTPVQNLTPTTNFAMSDQLQPLAIADGLLQAGGGNNNGGFVDPVARSTSLVLSRVQNSTKGQKRNASGHTRAELDAAIAAAAAVTSIVPQPGQLDSLVNVSQIGTPTGPYQFNGLLAQGFETPAAKRANRQSNTNTLGNQIHSAWCADVGDQSVWTIVGIEMTPYYVQIPAIDVKVDLGTTVIDVPPAALTKATPAKSNASGRGSTGRSLSVRRSESHASRVASKLNSPAGPLVSPISGLESSSPLNNIPLNNSARRHASALWTSAAGVAGAAAAGNGSPLASPGFHPGLGMPMTVFGNGVSGTASPIPGRVASHHQRGRSFGSSLAMPMGASPKGLIPTPRPGMLAQGIHQLSQQQSQQGTPQETPIPLGSMTNPALAAVAAASIGASPAIGLGLSTAETPASGVFSVLPMTPSTPFDFTGMDARPATAARLHGHGHSISSVSTSGLGLLAGADPSQSHLPPHLQLPAMSGQSISQQSLPQYHAPLSAIETSSTFLNSGTNINAAINAAAMAASSQSGSMMNLPQSATLPPTNGFSLPSLDISNSDIQSALFAPASSVTPGGPNSAGLMFGAGDNGFSRQYSHMAVNNSSQMLQQQQQQLQQQQQQQPQTSQQFAQQSMFQNTHLLSQ